MREWTRWMLAAAVAAAPMAAWAEEEIEDEYVDALTELEEMAQIVADEFTQEVERFLEKELPRAEQYLKGLEERMKAGADELELKWEYLETKMNMVDMVHEMREAMHEYPEVYPEMKRMKRLELGARELVQAYHESESETEREKLREDLRTQLAEVFGISQQLREREAQEVERELERVRKGLETRAENREAIIDRQVHMMLDDFDPYEW